MWPQLFLGTLREAEVERINDRMSQAIMETCLAMTIFREGFNIEFCAMFTVGSQNPVCIGSSRGPKKSTDIVTQCKINFSLPWFGFTMHGLLIGMHIPYVPPVAVVQGPVLPSDVPAISIFRAHTRCMTLQNAAVPYVMFHTFAERLQFSAGCYFWMQGFP